MLDLNPIPPSSEPTSLVPVPSYKLFDANAVTIATVLGGPIPGTILIAQNYRRLGQKDDAVTALVLGVLALGAAIGLGFILPQSTSYIVGIMLAIGIRKAAESLQGKAIDHHVNQGGQLGSKWAAAGLGTVFLVIFAALILTSLFMTGPKISVGPAEIYYKGSATRAEATALSDQLKTIMHFGSRESTVVLDKSKDGTVLSFVVHDGVWDQSEVVAGFEEIGRQVAPTIGGFPIKVRLLNASRDVKKEVSVGEAMFGSKDNIYYLGAASDSDAQALGAALKSAGYFKDAGASVLLAKDSDGTVMSFVVKDGFWNDPAHVAAFEKIVRLSASSVGGLPVKLRLVNASVEVEKEEMVN